MPGRTTQRPPSARTRPSRQGGNAATSGRFTRSQSRSAPAGRFGRSATNAGRRPSTGRRPSGSNSSLLDRLPLGGGQSKSKSKGASGTGSLLKNLSGALGGGKAAKRGGGSAAKGAGGLAAIAGLAGLALKNRSKIQDKLGGGRSDSTTVTSSNDTPHTITH